MQLFLNNWSARLTSPLSSTALMLQIPGEAAVQLSGLGGGDHYLLTLAAVDNSGTETAWEIVRATAVVGGSVTLDRAQEGTVAAEWPVDTLIEARLTAGGLSMIRDVADAAVPSGSLAAVATSGAYADLTGKPIIPNTPAEVGAATAAQGAKADTAVQPGSLAAVATSGAYSDLSGKPALPATAGDIGAIPASDKGAALGVATLDAGAKIPLAQLPAAAITDTFVVNTEAAMLALGAQVGDVAIRPDIVSSFILQAEPASALGNWQQILTPSIGGGAPVGSAAPQALGMASPGVSGSASREDHVHPMPSAADVGAAAAAHGHGDATPDAAGFLSAADKAKLDGIAEGGTANADTDSLAEGSTNLYHTASRVRAVLLTGLSLADSTVVAVTDSVLQAIGKLAARLALAFDRANHTGSQEISTVTGLQAALAQALFSPVVTEPGSERTSLLTDAGSYLRFTSTSGKTYTLQPQASVTWIADSEIHGRNAGTSNLTLTPGSGVTLNAPYGGTLLVPTGGSFTLKRVGADEWDVIGQTVAA